MSCIFQTWFSELLAGSGETGNIGLRQSEADIMHHHMDDKMLVDVSLLGCF